MAVAAFATVGAGLLLILSGLYVSVSDWRRRGAAESPTRERGTRERGFAESVTALGKLADALATKPLGLQLIILGIVVLLVGGIVGGLGSI